MFLLLDPQPAILHLTDLLGGFKANLMDLIGFSVNFKGYFKLIIDKGEPFLKPPTKLSL